MGFFSADGITERPIYNGPVVEENHMTIQDLRPVYACRLNSTTSTWSFPVIRFRTPLLLLAAAILMAATASAPGRAPGSKAYLPNVGKGQARAHGDRARLDRIRSAKMPKID